MPPEDLQQLGKRCQIPGFDFEIKDFTTEFASMTLLAHNDVEAAGFTSALNYKDNPHISLRAFTHEMITFDSAGDGPTRGHNKEFNKKMQAMQINTTDKFWPAHNATQEYVGWRSYHDNLSFHAGMKEYVANGGQASEYICPLFKREPVCYHCGIDLSPE